MTMKTLRITLASLCFFLLAALPAGAAVIPFDLEIGYRWYDVSGNDLVYRSQINERSGFLVRAFTMATNDLGGSDFRVDVSDFGSGPASALRIESGRAGGYRLRVGYRRLDAFSALPEFANPLLAQGIALGQHNIDQRRSAFDADIEFLPGSRFAPFVGYSRGQNEGPVETTYFVGQDEFSLLNSIDETEQEFRAGFAFELGKFAGNVTQGWRDVSGSESVTLNGTINGNNSGSVLGQPVKMETFTRRSDLSVSAPFTNVVISGRPINRLNLIANYVRISADAEGTENESATGSFVSFGIGSFFKGLSEQVTSDATNKSWRGDLRAEYEFSDGIDFTARYQREDREIDGSGLITSLYIQSVTFGGLNAGDIQDVINSENLMDRQQDVYSAGVSARLLGPFSLRAQYSVTSQNFNITPDAEEIVVPGGQGGEFERRINTFDLGATFTKKRLTIGAFWTRDRADDPVLRTDFIDRDRYRLRAMWSTPQNFLRLAATAEQLEQNNLFTGIGFDGTIKQYSGDVEVAPLTWLRLRGSASQYKADSSIAYRRPENFAIGTSVYAEDGVSYEGGIGLLLKAVTIDAGYSRFTNEGTVPFDIDRYRVRVVYDFMTRAGIAAEFSKDKYAQTNLPLSDYDANRYGLYLRLRP
jgi:hypothetical protein